MATEEDGTPQRVSYRQSGEFIVEPPACEA
jgi:hypothetical protein